MRATRDNWLRFVVCLFFAERPVPLPLLRVGGDRGSRGFAAYFVGPSWQWVHGQGIASAPHATPWRREAKRWYEHVREDDTSGEGDASGGGLAGVIAHIPADAYGNAPTGCFHAGVGAGPACMDDLVV